MFEPEMPALFVAAIAYAELRVTENAWVAAASLAMALSATLYAVVEYARQLDRSPLRFVSWVRMTLLALTPVVAVSAVVALARQSAP